MAQINVKCPCCGKIFIIADQPNIDNKTFTCTVCKTRSVIGPNRVVIKPKIVPPVEEETEYGPNYKTKNNKDTQYSNRDINDDEKTIVKTDVPQEVKMASLVDSSGVAYPLCVGINGVGRKAQNSKASIQIAVDDKFMSRSHAVIEVRKSGDRYLYILKNWENKNASYLNGVLIGTTDQLVLNDGDKVLLGKTELTFKK